MNNSRRGMIPPYAFFCLLFVSRIVVTLTYVQGVSVGVFSTDILISISLSFLLLLLLSLPAIISLSKGKSPLDNRFVSILYSLYYLLFASITISRFAYFATNRTNLEISMPVVIILVSVAMCYGAYLGIEAIGRYGFICAILLVLTLVAVFGLNVHNLLEVNFYPLIVNSKDNILQNALLFTSNSVAPAFLLALRPRVNGKIVKPYVLALLSSYGAIFLLILFCVGVMGSSARLQSYPVFTLFQMASLGGFSRLDMFHTGFWILAVLMKCSAFIYCASICIKPFSHAQKCIGLSLLSLVIAIVIDKSIGNELIEPVKIVSMIVFGVFCVLLPLIFLVLRRKNEKI